MGFLKSPTGIGTAIGALLGLGIALAMDLLLGQPGGGGWSQAVIHDLHAWTGHSFAPGSLVVGIGVVLAHVVMSAICAVMGAAAGALVGWVLRFLRGI